MRGVWLSGEVVYFGWWLWWGGGVCYEWGVGGGDFFGMFLWVMIVWGCGEGCFWFLWLCEVVVLMGCGDEGWVGY